MPKTQKHRLCHKSVAFAELSPLSRFCRRFYRATMWSWRELFCAHNFKGGIFPGEDEFQKELPGNRKLSVIKTFEELAGSGTAHEDSSCAASSKVAALMEHYGVERVSVGYRV